MGRWFGPLIWVCCLCGVGCGFDRSPLKGESSVGSPIQGGDRDTHTNGTSHGGGGDGGSVSTMHGAGGSGGSNIGGSGGTSSMMATDAGGAMHDAAPPAAHDSGTMHAGTGGSAPDPGTPDAGHPQPTPDAGIIPGTYTPCNGNGDTTTCPAGWKCYGGQPNTMGHCAEACEKDSDCTDYDGFDFTCFTDDGKCRIDCGSSGSQGACPAELTCVLDLTNNYRCRFPPNNNGGSGGNGGGTGGNGGGSVSLYQPCNTEHGDADCINGLHCYRADGSQVHGPGYCTTDCYPIGQGQGPECFNPFAGGGGNGGGNSYDLSCTDDVCRFECRPGDPCPNGMECEVIDGTGVCHYPAQ